MKRMILLTALPGAGKSTWAKNYVDQHQNEKVFIVSSDEIRKELGGSYQYFLEEGKVRELFLSRTKNYAKQYDDVTVIMDSTNLKNEFRKLYLESTPEFDEHILVHLDCDYDLACKRNLERDEEKVVPDYAMVKLFNELEEISEEIKNSYNKYLRIKMV